MVNQKNQLIHVQIDLSNMTNWSNLPNVKMTGFGLVSSQINHDFL